MNENAIIYRRECQKRAERALEKLAEKIGLTLPGLFGEAAKNAPWSPSFEIKALGIQAPSWSQLTAGWSDEYKTAWVKPMNALTHKGEDRAAILFCPPCRTSDVVVLEDTYAADCLREYLAARVQEAELQDHVARLADCFRAEN